MTAEGPPSQRPRARDMGVTTGHLQPGPQNAITDLPGVLVGHTTLWAGDAGPDACRTGVTAICPTGGNVFVDKVAAAIHVINGFGKLTGSTQVGELGEIETPIVLTNTLSVGAAFEGVVRHTLELNPGAMSVNPVVGECNDGVLNAIRRLYVTPEHVLQAIAAASGGPVTEGVIGAGTGMTCFGWKGGIGTASRVVLSEGRESPGSVPYVVGVLVLANYGLPRELIVGGVPVGDAIRPSETAGGGPGSCVVILATDAPLGPGQLARLARRVQSGLARTGSFCQHGSGEYAIAFSTSYRRHGQHGASVAQHLDRLFEAVVEATAEAVLNALFVSDTAVGRDGVVRHGLPVSRVLDLLEIARE